jgi:cyclophilin family peptidyl-prolyl cis-trans isomerase
VSPDFLQAENVMKIVLTYFFALAVLIGCSGDETETAKKEITVDQHRPRVVMETEMGNIVMELFPDAAPNHVMNLLTLTDDGFYNGLTFHRVLDKMLIQTGSPDGSVTGTAGYNIPSETSNIPHMPGSVGMARGDDPNSASSQFYICLAQLADLDGRYTVFGQVVEGMDVAHKIGAIETTENEIMNNEKSRPVEPVRVVRMYREGKEPPGDNN